MSSNFTVDWFSQNIRSIGHTLLPVANDEHLEILEIGSFEGRSTVWFLENLKQAQVTCVDTFEGGEEHAEIDMESVRERFDQNIQPYADRVTTLVGTSEDILKTLEYGKYDVVYVDGSHQKVDVIFDAVMAYRLVRKGGYILFDDYLGGGEDRPGPAIDAFLALHRNCVREVYRGYQIHVEKL